MLINEIENVLVLQIRKQEMIFGLKKVSAFLVNLFLDGILFFFIYFKYCKFMVAIVSGDVKSYLIAKLRFVMFLQVGLFYIQLLL